MLVDIFTNRDKEFYELIGRYNQQYSVKMHDLPGLGLPPHALNYDSIMEEYLQGLADFDDTFPEEALDPDEGIGFKDPKAKDQ